MYKDVWKKFGAKILIVMCSVLLLGGVAIAAPRLRAAGVDGNTDISATNTPDELTYKDDETLIYPTKLKFSNGAGNDVSFTSTSQQLIEDAQGNVTGVNLGGGVTLTKQNGDWNQAGEVTVRVNVSQSSSLGISGVGTCTYMIQPQTVVDVDVSVKNNAERYPDYRNSTNELVMYPLRELTPADFTVSVTKRDGSIVPLSPPGTGSNGEYSVFNVENANGTYSNTAPTSYGNSNCYIRMKNYKISNSQYYEKNNGIRILHHIRDYDINIQAGSNSWLFDNFTQTSLEVAPTVTVTQKTDDNTADFDSGWYRVEAPDGDPDTGQYTIKVRGRKENLCVGEVTIAYTITGGMETFLLKADDAANAAAPDAVVLYDEGKNTYKIQEMTRVTLDQYSLWIQKSSGDEKVAVNGDQTGSGVVNWNSVTFENDFMFVKDEEEIPGATAGMLKQKITVNRTDAEGGSLSGYLYYTVKRELADTNGVLNDKLHFDPPADAGNPDVSRESTVYEYDGNTHRMLPRMYFEAADGDDPAKKYYLQEYKTDQEGRSSGDYNISYTWFNSGSTGTPGRDVGTVLMQIVGASGSYYTGSIANERGTSQGNSLANTARYRVKGREVSKPDFNIQLLDEETNEQKNEYLLNTPAQTIVDNAYLYEQNNPIFKITDAIGTQYTASFFRKTNNQWRPIRNTTGNLNDLNLDTPGDYRVVFTLTGNYVTPEGSGLDAAEKEISCDFKIKEFDLGQYEFEPAGCKSADNAGCQDEFATEHRHIYNGSAHKPQVIMRRSGTSGETGKVDSLDGELYHVHHYRYASDDVNVERDSLKEAGSAIAYVWVVGAPEDEYVQVDVPIAQRTLTSENFTFSESDGFSRPRPGSPATSGSAIQTHPYCGKGQRPTLTELKVSHLQISEDVTLTVANQDFTISEGLYREDGTRYNPLTINKDNEYYYKIQLTNKNYAPRGSDLLIGPFKFEPKSLTAESVDIIPKEDVIAYSEYTSAGEDGRTLINKYLGGQITNKSLTVKDGEEVLDYGTDYQIAVLSDNVDGNGTITFTLSGVGCYIGESESITIYVGSNITTTMVRAESNEGTYGHPSGPVPFAGEPPTAELEGRYTNTAPTLALYNLHFLAERESADDTKTYLIDPNQSNLKLLINQQYLVEFARSEYQNENNENKLYYFLRVSGINGYYGTAYLKYEVGKRKMSDCDVEVIRTSEYTYIGPDVAVPVDLVITYNGETLIKGTDYTVIYDRAGENEPTEAGDYGFSLQGINRYEGTRREVNYTHTIKPRNIADTISGGSIDSYNFTLRMEDHYTYVKGGMKPAVKLEYKYRKNGVEKTVELQEGTDYVCEPFNTNHVCSEATPNDQHAKVRITGMRTASNGERGNFCNFFDNYFRIDPVNLETDCAINLTPTEYEFSASRIKPGEAGGTGTLVVRQYVSDDVELPDGAGGGVEGSGTNRRRWVPVESDEYEISWTGNYYTSGDSVTNSSGSSEGMESTRVEVTGLYNEEHPETGKNYKGYLSLDFKIVGYLNEEYSPNNNGDIISRTKIAVDGNKIPYSTIIEEQKGEDVGTSGMTVVFEQREEGTTAADNKFATRTLKWGRDYKVWLNETGLTSETIPSVGEHDGEIRAVLGGNFRGSRPAHVIVTGDLSGTETKITPINGATITTIDGEEYIVINIPDSDDELSLDQFISVECGDNVLGHRSEYQFEVNGVSTPDTMPDMTPGQKSVRIKCTDASKNYVLGNRKINYWVRQSLDSSSYVVENIEPSYEYNHKANVIDLDKVEVYYKNIRLNPRTDYTIAFEDDDGYSVTDSVPHRVVITPKGNYAGDPKKIPFHITKYKIKNDDLVTGRMTVDADDYVIYTGGNAFPKVNSVKVKAKAVSGSGITTEVNIYGKDDENRPKDKEIAYELKPMGGYNNVDFSNGSIVKCLLSGTGNYEGELVLEYRIDQKDIRDGDVKFSVPEGDVYDYLNGKEIKPEPEGIYNNRVMIGVEYKGNGSIDPGTDYTYTYPKDVFNVGDKTIHITGRGNFKGDIDLNYRVKPLNLEETTLEFAPEEVIYDGKEQKPSFTLSYEGEQILSYNKTSGVHSDPIKDVKVEFGGSDPDNKDNINATTPGNPATVTLSFDPEKNSNYEGTKTGHFVIQPASLEGHVVFMYHPEGETGNMELDSNLHLPWTGEEQKPEFPASIGADTELAEKQAGAYYEFAGKNNNGNFLMPAENADATVGNGDYTIDFKYVEPDSEDTDVRDDYGDADGRENCKLAGKVKVTITGINNYKDSASFWYYIGDDISADGSARLQTNTAIYNAKRQPPTVIVSGISRDKYTVARYKGEVKNENFIAEKDIIDAATYYVRLEGNPTKGTYATKPITLTYTIQPRPISNSVVIDGFKKEYNYTGIAICPIGISVTDYIDRTKYKLTENEDYTLTYTNNINVGTATINVNGEGNFKGTAAARFAITSSMISSGSNGTPGGSVSNGSGQISGAVAVAPDDVRVTLDAGNAMYYTGKQLTPAVTISGMTQNTDYTVTYSNNIEVGTGVITITGMGNNNGTITKNFRIVAKLSDCKVTNIPDQQYTGSAVEPLITVTCGNTILTKDKDYTVSFVNNVEIGTATAMIRAAGNANYIGSLTATFNIGNNVGGFIVSGYAPTYPYTGSAITPAVTVESGSTRLQQGTDYTVSYENNVNAGSASIIVKGAGKYTGTQTVNFIIEPRSIQVCDTTEVEDKTYTGDAYTPSITVRDSGKVLQNGVDYTLTYSDNVNPGLATITIQGMSNNYTGTKKITFRIGGVAVSGLQVSAINATSIKLKWQQQGYADGYQICNSKSKVVKTVNGSNASTTVTGLKPGKTYKYKVRSYTTNSQGERSYSAASAVVTATTKLETPTVTLKRNGTGRMRIKWTKSTNADGYEIFYKNTKGAKYRRIKKIDDVNTRICNVRGIKSGKKCYVRVRAFKKTGSTTLRSAMSKTKTIKVK